MSKGEFLSAKTKFSTAAKLSALVFQFVHENESKPVDLNIFQQNDCQSKGRQVVNEARSCISPPCTQRPVFMTAATFEAASCPRAKA